jgi:hypothetical protein
MLEGPRRVPVRPPLSGDDVQLGDPIRPVPAEIGEQVRPQELLDAVGVALRRGGRHERGLAFERGEHASGVLPSRQFGGEPARNRFADADHAKELLHVFGQPGENLSDEVVGNRALVAGELRQELVGISGGGQAESGEAQAGCPSAGAPVQQPDLRGREMQTRPLVQLRGLGRRESHLRGTQLPQPARQAQPWKRQRGIAAARQDELHAARAVPDEDLEAVQGLRLHQLVNAPEPALSW